MLDRVKIIKKLEEAREMIESDHEDLIEEGLFDDDNEQLDNIDTVLEVAMDTSKTDQEVDDLAFKLGLDAYLYWKEK